MVSVTPKTRTITNGTANDGSVVEQSFYELYNNDQSLATEVNNIETGTYSFTGVKTFGNGLKTDTITDNSGNGIAVNNAILQNGYANLSSVRGTINSVDTTNDVLTTLSAHSLNAGDAVKVRVIQGGALPGGIVATTTYYASVPTSTTLSLYDNYTDAVGAGSTGKLDITSVGSGIIQLIGAPLSSKEGDFWLDGTGAKVRVNGSSLTIGAYPTGFHGSAAPVYSSSTQFTVANIRERDSSDAVNITKNTSTTVDISTTGLNGLAQSSNLTGTIAYANASATVTGTGTAFTSNFKAGDTIWDQSNSVAVGVVSSVGSDTSITLTSSFSGTGHSGATFRRGTRTASSRWYLYAISDGVTPGLILSNRNVAGGDTLVDLPSGYNYSRQLIFDLYLDGSSNIRPFMAYRGDKYTDIIFRDFDTGYSVLVSGNSTSAFTNPGGGTNINLSAYVPPVSKAAFLNGQIAYSSGSGTWGFYLKNPDGASTAGMLMAWCNSVGQSLGTFNNVLMPLNNSQQVAYRVDGNLASLYVYGYRITEIP